MTLQELKSQITYLITTKDEVGLTLYVVYNNKEGEEQIRIADIDSQSAMELKTQFLTYLSEKFLDNETLSLMKISEGDVRKNTAFLYDLNERPEGINSMNIVAQDDIQPQFSFSNDDFNNIKAFIITVGNESRKMILFKKHHHLSIIRGLSAFGLRISNHRFVRVREDIIKLSPNVDFLQINGKLIIINLKTLESGYGFESIIRRKASENILAIESLDLLEDISVLQEMASEIRQAKLLMRIKSDSPVMRLPKTTVIEFVKNYKPIMKKFRLSDDGLHLKLDTKVSKMLFLSLMNDDLLTSELTKLYYEGISKDPMPIES